MQAGSFAQSSGQTAAALACFWFPCPAPVDAPRFYRPFGVSDVAGWESSLPSPPDHVISFLR